MLKKKYKTIKVKYLGTLSERSRGLIGKKNVYPVYFKTRFGIHTFGMLMPIDVIVLDRGCKIVKLKKNLRPNRLFFWNPKYYHILELPAGMVDKKKIEIGRNIVIKDTTLGALLS